MRSAVARIQPSQVARPLKTLIPLIQSELQLGNDAGREHYRIAGEMLIEAKDQVGYGGWSRWLAKNFDLTPRTANNYMRWARHRDEFGKPLSSIHEMTGGRERRREDRQSKQQQDFRRVRDE